VRERGGDRGDRGEGERYIYREKVGERDMGIEREGGRRGR
jgi:hypothetical protein